MPTSQEKSPLTAYPRTEAYLRRTLAAAPVHVESLLRPLQRCRLERCRGMCCYDGVYLGVEEAEVVARLARTEATFFAALGLHLPREVVVSGAWENVVSGLKTAVAPWPEARGVEGFPAHFNATACVFHLPDGRCGLQALSAARGRHPWHDKPTGCWLHPLTPAYAEKHALGLEDEQTDSCRLPHYDGFVPHTPCGGTFDQGRPAYEVLRDELEFLGRIVGRDFHGEIAREAATASRWSLKVLPD